jgi:hypothetical protein
MTSNDPDKLPPELIRAGRVDASIEFVELPGGKQVEAYVEGLLQSLGLLTELAGLPKFLSAGQGRPHAQVTAQVIERVRRHLLTNGTE